MNIISLSPVDVYVSCEDSGMVSDTRSLLTFTYVHLLLDVTKLMEGDGSFEAFLSAIIYIGRGTGPRAEQHLIDAKIEQDKNKKAGYFLASRKLSIINYLWYMQREVGVVVSQFNVPSVVADTVEHAMIETVGMAELTNKIPGNTSRYRLNNPDEVFELGIYQVDQFYREHGDPSAATIPAITRHQIIVLRKIH